MDVVILIGPVLLLSYRFPYASLLLAIGIFVGLIYDHLHNFASISYANLGRAAILSLPQEYLPFSLIVAVGGICLAIRSVLIRL